QRVERPVAHGDHHLRRALGAAGVAIDLDEAGGEIDRAVALEPERVVGRPVVALPGLEEAGESAERRSLRFRRVLGRRADLAARRGELLGVAPGRNLAVGRAGAVDLLLEGPVALDQ